MTATAQEHICPLIATVACIIAIALMAEVIRLVEPDHLVAPVKIPMRDEPFDPSLSLP